jgi:hypothetical protein
LGTKDEIELKSSPNGPKKSDVHLRHAEPHTDGRA